MLTLYETIVIATVASAAAVLVVSLVLLTLFAAGDRLRGRR